MRELSDTLSLGKPRMRKSRIWRDSDVVLPLDTVRYGDAMASQGLSKAKLSMAKAILREPESGRGAGASVVHRGPILAAAATTVSVDC